MSFGKPSANSNSFEVIQGGRIGVLIAGVKGRMGQALLTGLADYPDLHLSGALEHPQHPEINTAILPGGVKIVAQIADAAKNAPRSSLIDFTTPEATLAHVADCVKNLIPMVIGTTGINADGMKIIKAATQKIPVVMAANYSIGVTLMLKLVEDLAAQLPESYDLEIVEAHHRMKKDAPSGTALRLAQALADGRKKKLSDVLCTERSGEIGARPPGQIGVQTIRGGDIVGDHTVCFAGPGERLEVIHRAHSRNNFASGALRAALWLWQTEGERGFRKPGLYDMFDVLDLHSKRKE